MEQPEPREEPRGTSLEREGSALTEIMYSRRTMLGGAALGVVGACAGAGALGAASKAADTTTHDAPVVKITKTYRALVRRGLEGPARIETVKLLPFSGRQVLVRNTAEHCCYSDVRAVLGPARAGPSGAPPAPPRILGHGGLGVIEAIGPEVVGLKPGDKVFISVTSQCGACYNCVRGRADGCLANLLPAVPVAETLDGIPVGQAGAIGGIAEYSVCYEERLTPYFSNRTDEEVALLTCSGSTGLGTTMTLHPIEAGSSVVVFGCGPVGLSAIQGARIQGATQIIAIDPIAMRRRLALKLGATDAIDPNPYGDKLVEHLRALTQGPTDRIFAGGRISPPGFFPMLGPDYVIEAVGAQQYPPKVESALDPTGIQALEQVWDLVPATGWGMTTGFEYERDATVSFSAMRFTDGSQTLCSCQNGGIQSRRDLPRFVRLLDEGRFDVKSMITHVHKFDDAIQAYQEIADRTVVANVIKFT